MVHNIFARFQRNRFQPPVSRYKHSQISQVSPYADMDGNVIPHQILPNGVKPPADDPRFVGFGRTESHNAGVDDAFQLPSVAAASTRHVSDLLPNEQDLAIHQLEQRMIMTMESEESIMHQVRQEKLEQQQQRLSREARLFKCESIMQALDQVADYTDPATMEGPVENDQITPEQEETRVESLHTSRARRSATACTSPTNRTFRMSRLPVAAAMSHPPRELNLRPALHESKSSSSHLPRKASAKTPLRSDSDKVIFDTMLRTKRFLNDRRRNTKDLQDPLPRA